MAKNGVKTVGFIGFNDPYGENWLKVFSALAEKAGITLVAIERYARTDSSVTGQALKLIAAKPDAVLIAAVGGPAVLPQATLRDQGYKGTVYQTHAVATDDFIRSARTRSKARCSRRTDAGHRRDRRRNPTSKVALAYIAAYEKQFGTKPATFGANTWDAGLLLERAIPDRAEDGEARHRGVPRRRCAMRWRTSARSSAARACSTCRRRITTAWTSARACWSPFATASSACCPSSQTSATGASEIRWPDRRRPACRGAGCALRRRQAACDDRDAVGGHRRRRANRRRRCTQPD